MWIIFRLVMLALGIGYRLSGLLAINAWFENYPGGVSLYVKNRKNPKTGAESAKVYLKIKSRIFFRLVPESNFLGYYKSAGFGSEVQVGDSEFDEAFYIATENAGVINKLRGDSDLRASFLRLRDLGFTKIISDGFGHLLMINPSANVHDSEDLARLLARIKNSLDLVPPSSFFSESFLIWVFALETLFYGLAGYALTILPNLSLDNGTTHLNIIDFILKGLLVVGVLLVGWIAVIFFALRKSSRGPVLLFDFTLPYFAAAVVGGFLIFGDLNQSLDKSKPLPSFAQVTDRYSKSTGGGKSRRTIYYLSLKFASNSQGIPEKLTVSRFTYYDFNIGDRIEITVRRGFFNSPYIYSIKLRDQDSGGGLSGDDHAPGLDEERLKKLSAWHPTLDPESKLARQTIWMEEKYASGKIRQKEPFVQSRRHGLATYWHENGGLYTTINWANGEKHGRIKLYYPSGVIEQSLSYQNGKLHGLCAWYSQAGVVTNMALYDHGVLVSTDLAVLSELGRSVGGIELK